jgi:hypothetical protein
MLMHPIESTRFDVSIMLNWAGTLSLATTRGVPDQVLDGLVQGMPEVELFC